MKYHRSGVKIPSYYLLTIKIEYSCNYTATTLSMQARGPSSHES